MADYRDPKVTTGTTKGSGTSRWIGIAVAVLAVLVLIAWFTGAFDDEVVVAPETVAPATEAPAEGTATEAPAAEQPAAPAQN